VLVTDALECARIPEDACLRIAPGLAERESLRQHMILLTSMSGWPVPSANGGRAHPATPPGGRSIQALLGIVVRVWFLILACCAGLSAAQNPGVQQLHALVPMRDGVRLAADVFLPADRTRLPAILERTPYGKAPASRPITRRSWIVDTPWWWRNVRGRYESEGVFRPLQQEPADGDDTLNWIARQAWSDGKVGMIGGSYRGIVQWKAALLANPHLKAIFPVVAGDDDYRDRFYSRGGAMKLGHRLEWMSENLKAPAIVRLRQVHAPPPAAHLRRCRHRLDSDMFQQAVAHPAFDSFWRALSVREQLSRIKVPVFSVGGCTTIL